MSNLRPHDAGNALGAALAVYREYVQRVERNLLPHLFLGLT